MGRPPGPLNDVERERNRVASIGRRKVHTPSADTDSSPDAVNIPAEILDGDDGLIQSRFRAYLKHYGMPRDWNESLTAEKVRREIATSVAAGIDVEEKRGRLVDRDQIKQVANSVRDLIYDALSQSPAKVVAAIPDLPNNYRASLILALQTQIDAACASAISDALKKHG